MFSAVGANRHLRGSGSCGRGLGVATGEGSDCVRPKIAVHKGVSIDAIFLSSIRAGEFISLKEEQRTAEVFFR